jgi:hypothetical protein
VFFTESYRRRTRPSSRCAFENRGKPCNLDGDIRPIYFDVIFEYISEIINPYIKIMSKRLNKRQQREAEELELLKAEKDRVATEKAAPVEEEEDEEEEEEEVVEGEAPVNAFAAVCHYPLFELKLTYL